ncbi:MAG: DUF1844 domain-containing protein [Desulfotignum sp.]|nr:DUF1844 domain-containing protein [Desulfotignum sp.]MCF8112270.1 DUF1844 domain-containing protein [Desulfotignum sp.]MCF8124648.1 DUF1844 domain-containing protein [Desulfotignum sp.]
MPEGNGFIMQAAKEAAQAKKEAEKKHTLPRVDFSSFILSIYSSGLVQLGKVEDPSTGQIKKDLTVAKYTVDMMAMLSEKTKGNLNKDEENLMRALLSEIRLAYVEAAA